MIFLAGLALGLVIALLAVALEPRIADQVSAWRNAIKPRAGAPEGDLREAIDERLKAPESGDSDRAMLGGVLTLRDLSVEDVMIHRTKMETLNADAPPADIIRAILDSGFTRFPVWRGKPDAIVGILHSKDLLAALQKNGGEAAKIDIAPLLQPPWFVPATRELSDQLNAFLRRKRQLAVVVDEYGEVMGLVTLEDILEEIVGDITDEHDTAVSGVRQQKDGSYLIDGATPIRDLNRSLAWSLPDEEATTLAGLVIHEARMIPDQGQVFTFHGLRFEVAKKRRHQITLIKATPLETKP